MKMYFKKYSWALFVGFFFPLFSGYSLNSWQYWFFIIGMVFLVTLSWDRK